MNASKMPGTLTAKDYASDQDLRWCPGCGDYAILKSVLKTLADLQVPREKTVFISGIGCAARFPYYVSTYGFHTIHGRAPTIATGTKLANPDLDIWVVTGDGDALSIGGNHLLHVLRRNVDMQILLFNNQIYGLTKGQSSPTSKIGTRSPSTPDGSFETPVSAAQFALGANARFVARAIDTDLKNLPTTLTRAHRNKGASFVEIFQNCLVYNDKVFADFTARATAEETQIHVVHGEPLVFGANRDKGLRLKPGTLDVEVVPIGDGGIGEADVLVHDETNHWLAALLAAMEPPTFPVALGVLYCDPATPYEANFTEATPHDGSVTSNDALNAMLRQGHTWTV